jgi:hypothetical protein
MIAMKLLLEVIYLENAMDGRENVCRSTELQKFLHPAGIL